MKVRDRDNEKPRRRRRLSTVPSCEVKMRVTCDRKQSGASDVIAYDFPESRPSLTMSSVTPSSLRIVTPSQKIETGEQRWQSVCSEFLSYRINSFLQVPSGFALRTDKSSCGECRLGEGEGEGGKWGRRTCGYLNPRACNYEFPTTPPCPELLARAAGGGCDAAAAAKEPPKGPIAVAASFPEVDRPCFHRRMSAMFFFFLF